MFSYLDAEQALMSSDIDVVDVGIGVTATATARFPRHQALEV